MDPSVERQQCDGCKWVWSLQLCDCSPATDAEKDINDAVSEVWCQSESWRLRQFTHACCVVQPRGERHVLHWNYATMKTWILKLYQWSAHVMWHSLLGSELSFDPVFIKRWGAHRNRQVLLWLHVSVCVSFSSSLVIMWHTVLTWHYMKSVGNILS